MNADPQAMLQRATHASRPLVDRVADPFRQIIAAPVRWVEAASEAAKCDGEDLYCGVGRGYRELCTHPDSPLALGPPVITDLPAEGWVKHTGPDGREFWHHLSLGPAPWDRAMVRERPVSINGCIAGIEEDAVLRLPSKEKPVFKEKAQRSSTWTSTRARPQAARARSRWRGAPAAAWRASNWQQPLHRRVLSSEATADWRGK
ncbi:unnamed protein product [Effrenium voratum]|nr:unnamed protein product [Effrenium voratum]